MRLLSTLPKNQQQQKADKQRKTQNIKDPTLKDLQDTISIL